MQARTSQRWWPTWGLAILLASAAWCAFEWYWRAHGYAPTVMDSKDLWAEQRARVSLSAPPRRIALLGASRIQYGISPDVFRREARQLGADVDPVMLALNGQYPLATLRDLARDERFRGIAIVGIDALGFDKLTWEMQADSVAYFHHEYTPARALHRRLLTQIQPYLVTTRPDFAWSAVARGYLDHDRAPTREYVTFHRDRSGATDYGNTSIEHLRNARIEGVKRHYAAYVPPPPERWLAEAREVIGWVSAINARGGRVVFYREPVSSAIREFDERFMPRAKYLDALAKIMPAIFINFEDYDALNIDTPDTSHIDQKDIARHTTAFVKVLRERGVF